jgi:hypothetical protein
MKLKEYLQSRFIRCVLINLLMSLISPELSVAQQFTNGVYMKGGKTFEVDKKVHQITTAETLHFSNDLIVKTSADTDFTINILFQEVFDLDKPAHKAKFGTSTFSGTLMKGTATVVYSGTNENSFVTISTPMTDLELYRGVFIINVTTDSVVVYIVEGSAKAHGEKKIVRDASAGNFLMAAPTKIGILEDKYSIGSNAIPESGMKKLADIVEDVIKTKGQFLFVIVDGKIVGVNMN